MKPRTPFYKFILSLLLALSPLSACVAHAQNAQATPIYSIDAQATAHAPWTAGEKIPYSEARGIFLDSPLLYRKFIGITTDGHYVVQDFYARENVKYTDPYVLLKKEDVGSVHYDSRELAIDGPYITWYPTGEKKGSRTFQSGKVQGVYIEWYPNGQKAGEVSYQNGMLEGRWRSWHRNGQQSSEANYHNGFLDGYSVQWDENGQKTVEGYSRDGKPVGIETWWHDNGQKRTEGRYDENGLQQGVWTRWDKNGDVIKRTTYRDGKPIEVWERDTEQ